MKTDLQLQQDVMAELKWEPSVHAAQIGVEVTDSIVTLAGEVSSYAEKWNAERAAQRVAGVKGLAVEMTVKLSGLGKRTDADIAESAKNILNWTGSLPTDAVKVLVEGGWLTLSGQLAWQYQRQLAAECVSKLVGVTGVSNQISIKPSATAPAVKADIEAALKRTSIADAKKITVGVKGSVVTLSGTVHSWDERDTATHAAWGTPGVYDVIGSMTLA